MKINNSTELLLETELTVFFRELLGQALGQTDLSVTEDAQHYLVKLLTEFTHSESLYQSTPDGLMVRPLALQYADAVDAASELDRNLALKRLGDIALFVSGVFPESLDRRCIDLDYYISMGGSAYSYLSENANESRRWRVLQGVFQELAMHFVSFADLLSDIFIKSGKKNATDLLRMYESWLKTGSTRLYAQLLQHGIQPNPAGSFQH